KLSQPLPIPKQNPPELLLHAQFQFHPPFLPSLPPKKPPHSLIKPHPTLFLFPTLQPPNIPYKIPHPLANFQPLPPIFQPLNQPLNHLSTRC
ncbi:phosphate acyltransferase, partial [Bacillus pumilus]|uniref:phosphate acyltransferase n=1 Tax=Bacillus pumilus TaxID=1408 RepID=UPI0037042497